MKDKAYELVFSGAVVEVTRTGDEGYRATFDVDRVWKGSVSKRFDLYVWELAPEIDRYQLGRRYVVAARQVNDLRVRQGAGLSRVDIVAFTPVQCTNQLSLEPNIIRKLGRSHPPK